MQPSQNNGMTLHSEAFGASIQFHARLSIKCQKTQTLPCSSEFHYLLITMQETLVLLSLIFFLSIFLSDGFVHFTSKIRNESYRLRETKNRCQPRRWYGGYKTASKRLADIPKKKKMKLDLVANGVIKTVEKKRQETLQHVLTKGESPL